MPLLLSSRSSLYTLNNSSLSDGSFANVIPVCDLSSNSLDTFFHRSEVLILMKSRLFYVDCAFGVIS